MKIPIGGSYNRITGEMTQFYRGGTAEEYDDFFWRFLGLPNPRKNIPQVRREPIATTVKED